MTRFTKRAQAQINRKLRGMLLRYALASGSRINPQPQHQA
jgi:hypothetical protein